MGKLFLDKFVIEEGFSSTEDYIQERLNGNTPWIGFPNLDYYLSLFKNNFLRVNNIIQTSDRGIIDESYEIIDNDGNLRGVTEISCHQGMKGIFSPKKILIGERISAGWAVYGRTLEKNIYLMKKD